MENLKRELDEITEKISDLKDQIQKEKAIADNNVIPLKEELSRVKAEKTRFASKSDFDSVEACRRKENNLKFKISAQRNRYSLLMGDLSNLKAQRNDLENRIKLERDRIRREEEILMKMDLVLKNYCRSQNLKSSAIEANISPDHVEQWLEWGRNDFGKTYTYFYTQITEADNYFKELEAKRLKKKMDDVLEAYRLTNSLKEASLIANVSFDTVQYWIEWGSKGFGEENSYFYRKFKEF